MIELSESYVWILRARSLIDRWSCSTIFLRLWLGMTRLSALFWTFLLILTQCRQRSTMSEHDPLIVSVCCPQRDWTYHNEPNSFTALPVQVIYTLDDVSGIIDVRHHLWPVMIWLWAIEWNRIWTLDVMCVYYSDRIPPVILSLGITAEITVSN